ncbi:hypothetical protein HD554DRAFT_2001347, partial [Boletus coccyginus]
SLPDSGAVREKWADEYGVVCEVPRALIERRVVRCEPKSHSAFLRVTYILMLSGSLLRRIWVAVGKGSMSAEGEYLIHKRKTLAPVFSSVAIRKLTSVFCDLAHKV